MHLLLPSSQGQVPSPALEAEQPSQRSQHPPALNRFFPYGLSEVFPDRHEVLGFEIENPQTCPEAMVSTGLSQGL